MLASFRSLHLTSPHTAPSLCPVLFPQRKLLNTGCDNENAPHWMCQESWGVDMHLYIDISRYMELDKVIAALNNPVRRRILYWLKDRSNFPPALPEHADLDGVCVAYIQEKAGLSQSTISNYMGLLKQAGLVVAERHGQWTFYARDEDAIAMFLKEVGKELLSE